jgi:2-oxoglutarate ferredoxin oxidoreductase subunit alpha
LAAQCNFFAGYPITPASSILSEFISAFADGSGTAVQTEDEIAAIGQCIGAAMSGAKSLTASSGPGLSLYSENIGFAQMIEAPIVIVNCQRMGPATGGATATGEGDVMFARFVTAGGYPLPVLTATDASTAYRLTYEAFNIAEQYRTPVILLLSKDISLTRQSVDLAAIELPALKSRKLASPDESFQPYQIDCPDNVPAFSAVGGPRRVRVTGSIHDEEGLLTGDRSRIDRKLRHLAAKIESHRREWEIVDRDIDAEARVLVVCYGVADGAVREAVEAARANGHPVSRLTLYSLWPVAVEAIREAITSNVQSIVVPELNIGLYVEEIRRAAGTVTVKSVTRVDGGLIEPAAIVALLTQGTVA